MRKDYFEYSWSDYPDSRMSLVPMTKTDNKKRKPKKGKRERSKGITFATAFRVCFVAPLVFVVAMLSLIAAVSAIAQDRTIPKTIEWVNNDLIDGIQRGEHVHHIVGAGLGFSIDCENYLGIKAGVPSGREENAEENEKPVR